MLEGPGFQSGLAVIFPSSPVTQYWSYMIDEILLDGPTFHKNGNHLSFNFYSLFTNVQNLSHNLTLPEQYLQGS